MRAFVGVLERMQAEAGTSSSPHVPHRFRSYSLPEFDE